MEFPVQPTLITPVLGALPTFTKIVPTALNLPTFDGILPLEPEDTTLTTLPFVYNAYADIVQNALDGKIVDLTSYCVPTFAFLGEWRLAKDKILRKYHKARADLLRAAGQRNPSAMPGHVMLQLKDLSLEERRDLSDEVTQLADRDTKISLDLIESALKTGLESNAVRFDSHHKLQSANFEAASTIVDAGLKAAGLRVQAYNQTLTAFEAQVAQIIRGNEARIKEFEQFEKTLQISALEAEIQTLLMNVYQAQVKFEAEAAAMDLIIYDVYIINLELDKAQAEIEVSRAELVLAETNAVTAQYEIQKAQARVSLAELDKYKIRVDQAKLQVEQCGVRVDQAKMQLTSAIDLAQTDYEGQRNKVAMTKEDLQLAIMQAEEAIIVAETEQATTIANTVVQNAQQKIDNFAIEKAWDRLSKEVPDRSSRDRLASLLRDIEAQFRTDCSKIAMDRKDAMKAAAEAAAESEVTTDFYKTSV